MHRRQTKLNKPELIQLSLNTKANVSLQIINLTNEIKRLLDHERKLEADVSIIKNVNGEMIEQINEGNTG